MINKSENQKISKNQFVSQNPKFLKEFFLGGKQSSSLLNMRTTGI